MREGNFTAATQALGWANNEAIAERLQVNERTVRRSRQGRVVGERLIGQTLRIFAQETDKLAEVDLPPTFETFFEVR